MFSDISLDPRSGWDTVRSEVRSAGDRLKSGISALTGADELEKQRKAMEEETERQRREAEAAEQEREQAEAEETRRRRGQIRGRLQEQPNLFSILGSGQDTLG